MSETEGSESFVIKYFMNTKEHETFWGERIATLSFIYNTSMKLSNK